MAFSFSKWFKKSGPNADQPGHDQPAALSPVAAPAPAPAPALAPPASTPAAQAPAAQLPAARNVKTAMPNAVRPVSSLHEGTRTSPSSPSSVSLRNAPSPAPSTSVNRTVSFPGLTAVAAPAAPAPAPAPAASTPEPPPDAAIALTLGDFVDRIPANLLKADATVDRNREVVFQAADLYSDLARGRASVPVSTIQSVCPDLFGRPVTDTEDVEIPLPLPKLVEQLGAALQTRSDQVAEEDVGEIETPFLQVALEDSVRLPKPPASPAPAAPKTASPVAPQAVVRKPLSSVMPPPAPAPSAPPEIDQAPGRAPAPRSPNGPAPIGTVPPPSPSISVPTAQSVTPIGAGTKRPPSTVRASVAGGKIRLSGPAISSRSIAPVAANAAPATPLAPTGPAPARPSPGPAMPSSAASAPAQKKTARIQIPPIALRSGAGPSGSGVPGAPPPSRPPASGKRPASPAGKAMPFPEPLVSFRASPNEAPTPGTPAALPPITMPAPRNLPMTAPLALSAARMAIAPPPFPAAPMFAPPPAAPAQPAAVAVTPDAPPIALALAPILRGQPAALFAEGLDGDTAADQVPDDARVQFPMAFITSQLAQGRVSVPRAMFAAALPGALRHLVPEEGEPSEVTIPLQEVFQNLPTGALTHRHDQVTEEVGPEIPTPFSMKAEEDAQRLRAAALPVPAPEPEPQPEAVVEPAAELPPVETPAEPVLPADAPVEPMVSPTPEALAVVESPSGVAADPLVETPESHPEAETPFAEAAPEPAAMETQATKPEAVLDAPVTEFEPLPAFTLEPAENAATESPVETPRPDSEALASETQLPAEPANAEMSTAEAPVPEPVIADELPLDQPSAEAASEFAPSVKTSSSPARVHLPPLEPPVPETAAPAAHSNGVQPAEPAPVPVAPSAEEVQDALRAIFMVEDDLDAKQIVKLVGQMPGMKACAIMFGDGLKLAGELESIPNEEGFSAMTPAFFRRVGSYAQELELGEIQFITLQTERALLSFFMHGAVCLSVQHAGNRGFLPGVREKLLATTRELARMYAPPTASR